MASHSNSDVEDADLAMALRLPELSADALDERIGQSRPKEPPPAARLTDHFSGEQVSKLVAMQISRYTVQHDIRTIQDNRLMLFPPQDRITVLRNRPRVMN